MKKETHSLKWIILWSRTAKSKWYEMKEDGVH